MEYDQQQPPKRSRFDQVEPEPVRKSRFDVKSRSRSPAKHGEEDGPAHRSRSPLRSMDGPENGDRKKDAAVIAAEKAAAINAALKAKKGIQHVDVPPIRKVS